MSIKQSNVHHGSKWGAWRRDSLRSTLWVVPSSLVLAASLLFVGTYLVDRAAYRHTISLPEWVNSDSADAGRQVLIGLAAATITVAGVVFSITIVALTLASQQFGPRMLRNFIRDRGTQLALGLFVATFVYDVLALGSIRSNGSSDFVPHLSITVALVLVLGDLVVFIYFIHHVTKSIQLPQVIAGIAQDLHRSTRREPAGVATSGPVAGASLRELTRRLDDDGADVSADQSGYLQFISYERLVRIAVETDGVIRLLHRPGHFIVEGRPLAQVWPATAAPLVARQLARGHVTGPHRTLTQDPVFAVDQLVEIAIRALSPAVNDTFTALTCIDWLGDGLCKLSAVPVGDGVHRDRYGRVRVIGTVITFERIVNGAYDKIRQAGRSMPAVAIRQLDSLSRVMEYTINDEQRRALLRQATMILEGAEAAVPEPNDRDDVRDMYGAVVARAMTTDTAPPRVTTRQ